MKESGVGAKPVRAVVYARKSTGDDKDDGQSPSVQSQLAECAEFCRRKKYTVVAQFADDGISGRCWPAGDEWEELAQADVATNEYIAGMLKKRRPGFGEVFRLVAAGKAEVVVVRDGTRFCRPVTMSGLQFFLHQFLNKHRVKVEAIDGERIGYGNNTMESVLSVIKYAFMDDETRKRKEQSRAAKLKLRREGQYWPPHVPWGYVEVNGLYEPHPEYGPRLKKVFDAVLKGANPGDIIRQFDDEGIPPPYATRKGQKAFSGKWWPRSTIANILKNPVYCGLTRVEGKLVKCVKVKTSIVRESVWFEYQQLRASRTPLVRAARTSHSLLGGITRCGECGYSMSRHDAGNTNRAYRCIQRGEKRCQGSISSDNLEGFARHFFMLHQVMVEQKIRETAKLKDELPTLLAEQSRLQSRIDDVTDRIRRGNDDIDMYYDLLKGMRGDLLSAQRKIADLQSLPDAPAAGKIVVTDYKRLPEAEQREIIRLVLQRVVVHHGHIEFELVSGETFSLMRTATNKTKNARWLPAPLMVHANMNGLTVGLKASDFRCEAKAKRRRGEKHSTVTLLDGRLTFMLSDGCKPMRTKD